MKDLKPIIGLEIHVELKTLSKMFCGCPADHFAKAPNTQTCPVCLGLPGALPVPNEKAVDWTILMGLSLNCKINKESKFDRKHYFYPDLPKGYQISQYDEPFCKKGFIDTSEGRIGITRVHLEEDTGKLQHKTLDGEKVSLVDFNRSGVPLVEIVTDPEIHSGTQAKEYAQELQRIARYLEISDCDMEKGSMRLEANISWGLDLGYKVEVKNLNSFRFVDKAINFELKRQKELLDKGETPRQETRGWDEAKGETFLQRVKETAADYRYFPDPDLPPMEFSDDHVAAIKKTLPELPHEASDRLVRVFGVRKEYADIVVGDRKLLHFVEQSLELSDKSNISADSIVGFILNTKVDYKKAEPQEIITKIVKEKGSKVEDESVLEKWAEEALLSQPSVVADYKKGKLNAIGVLIGNIMKSSGGKADPASLRKILEKKLLK